MGKACCLPSARGWHYLSSNSRFGTFGNRWGACVASDERSGATGRGFPSSTVCGLALPIVGILRLSACEVFRSHPRTATPRLGSRTVSRRAIHVRPSSIPSATSPCARLTVAWWWLDAPLRVATPHSMFLRPWSHRNANPITPRIYPLGFRDPRCRRCPSPD